VIEVRGINSEALDEEWRTKASSKSKLQEGVPEDRYQPALSEELVTIL
jgi:hypothetical protein